MQDNYPSFVRESLSREVGVGLTSAELGPEDPVAPLVAFVSASLQTGVYTEGGVREAARWRMNMPPELGARFPQK